LLMTSLLAESDKTETHFLHACSNCAGTEATTATTRTTFCARNYSLYNREVVVILL